MVPTLENNKKNVSEMSLDSILSRIASSLQKYNHEELFPHNVATLRSELPSSFTKDEDTLLLKKSDQLPPQLKKPFLFLLFHVADLISDAPRTTYLKSQSESPLSLLRSTAEHFADYRKTPAFLSQYTNQIASSFHALYFQDPSDATLRKFALVLRLCFSQMKITTIEKWRSGTKRIQNEFLTNLFTAISSRMSEAEARDIESKILSYLSSDPLSEDSASFESFLDETAPFKTNETGRPQFDNHNKLVVRNPRAAFLHGLPIYHTKIIEGASPEDSNFVQATHLVHSIRDGALSATDIRDLVVACSSPNNNDRIQNELNEFLDLFANRDFRSLFAPLVLSLEYLKFPAKDYLETFLRDRVLPSKSADYFQNILGETLFADPAPILLAPKSLRFLAQHGLLPHPSFLVRHEESLPSTQSIIWKKALSLSDTQVDAYLESLRQPLLRGTLETRDFERGLKDLACILEGILATEHLEAFLNDIRLQYGNARSAHEAQLNASREFARQGRATRRESRPRNGDIASSEKIAPSSSCLTIPQVNERFFCRTNALRTPVKGIEENAIHLRGYRDCVKSELEALLPYDEVFSVSSEAGADSLIARLGIASVDFNPNDANYRLTLHFDDGQSFDGITLSGVSGAEASVTFPEHFGPEWVKIVLECELYRIFDEHLIRHIMEEEITPNKDYRLLFLSALGFPVQVGDDTLGISPALPVAPPVDVSAAISLLESIQEVSEVPFLDRNYQLFDQVTSLKGIHFSHSSEALSSEIAGLRLALSRRGITSLLPGGGSLIETAESPLKFLVPNIRVFHPEESRKLLEEYTGWKSQELPPELIDCHVCIADITFPEADEVQQLVFYISPASHDRDREVNLVGLQGSDPSEDLNESRLRIFRELELLLVRAFHHAVCREEYPGRHGTRGRQVEINLPAGPSDPNGVHQETAPQVIIQRGLESEEGPIDNTLGNTRRGIDHVYRMSPERVFEALLCAKGNDAAEKLYKQGGVAVPMDLYVFLHKIAPDIFHEVPNLTRGMNLRGMLEPVYSHDGVKKIHKLVFSNAIHYQKSWFPSGSPHTLDRFFEGIRQGAIVPSHDIPRSIMAPRGPLTQLSFSEDQTVRALLTLPCLNPYRVHIGPRKDVITLYRLSPYKPKDDARFRDATVLNSPNLGGQFRVISNGAARLSDHSLIATCQRSDAITLVARERNTLMHQNPDLHREDLLDLGPRAQAIIVFERDRSPNDTLRCFVHLSSARASVDSHENGNVTCSAPQNLARNSYFRAEVARCHRENQSRSFEGFDHAIDRTNPRFSKANIDRMREAGFWEWDRNAYDGRGGVPVDRSYILIFDGADIGVRQGLDNPKYAEFCEWCLRENIDSDWTPELQNVDNDLLPIQRYLFENVLDRHVFKPPRSETSL